MSLAVAPPRPGYEQATAELDGALDAVGGEGSDRAESRRALESALERVARYPDYLPEDERVQAQVLEARLALVWLHIADKQDDAARAAMDEAIRSARGRELPAGRFGPAVLRLFEQRHEALEGEGTGTIEVECGPRPCAVIINEAPAANPSESLYLGSYRVWVGGAEQGSAWDLFTVELHEPGQIERLVHRSAKPRGHESSVDLPPKLQATGQRLLPRWVELVGLSAGTGLLVAGAVLYSLHRDCSDDPTAAATRPRNARSSSAAPAALLGTGVGLMLLSGIMITVDEVRVGRNKGRQATLSWTLRF